MKKFISASLLFIFSIIRADAQQIRFEIQAGLSSSIKEIAEMDNRGLVCIATREGDLLLWDISRNRVGQRMNLEEEIYDMVFRPEDNLLIVSTPGHLYFYRFENGLLDEIEKLPAENPTALYARGQELFAACRNSFLRFSLASGFPEPKGEMPRHSTASYAMRISGDRLIEASNGGLNVYALRFSAASEEENSGMDTSSISEDYQGESPVALDRMPRFNTGWYAHWWDEGSKILYASREGSLLAFDHSGAKLVTKTISLPIENENYVTGLTRLGDRLLVGTRNGNFFQLDLPIHPGAVAKPVPMPEPSITYLAPIGELLAVGSFFGNISIYDPSAFNRVISLNDGSVPSINAVYLGEGNRMVTTHKDPEGAHIRIWDASKASLIQQFTVKTQQVIRVEFAGDSIKTYHADGAAYVFTPAGSSAYDSLRLAPPLVPDAPGFGLSLPDAEPMFIIQRDRKELREASQLPGNYQWQAGSQGYRVNYTVPPLMAGCASMPSYEIVQRIFRENGLLEYMTGWDLMDQDLFYMKACRYDEEKFIAYAKDLSIPLDLSLAFHKKFKSPPVAVLSIIDQAGDTIFKVKRNGLQYLQYHARQARWLIFYDSTAMILDPATHLVQEIRIQLPVYFHYAFNGKQLAITSSTRTTVYDLDTAPYETSWLSFGKGDFLVYDQQGYFRTRGRSAKIVGYENGVEKPFAYFDLLYNRPDILIRNLEGKQSEEAAAFAKAIEKRMKRFDGRIPAWSNENDFNTEHLPIHTNGNTLQLSSEKGVRNIWVNGAKEIPGPGNTIRLSPGSNKVEIEKTNRAGDTIFHHQVNFVYSTAPGREQWYFFGAGINHYADTSIALKYATTDIRDLAGLLQKKKPGIQTHLLFDYDAVRSGFAGWKEKLAGTKINDVVLVSLSGHGYLDSSGQFQFASPASTAEKFLSSVSYNELVSLLDAAPARKKILFIDACHSGLLDEELETRVLPEGVKLRSFRKKQAGSATTAFRLMQEEFLDLTKHNGTIVIAAAAGSEFAMESSAQGNGLFTWVLKKGLFEGAADRDDDGRITTSELQDYLGREVEKISKGGQKPSTNQDNQGIDWTVLEN